MIKVGIIGASGYAGAELIRYLIMHPEAEITYLASSTYAGKHISEAYPSLTGFDLPTCEKYDASEATGKADFFFQAQGNGNGMKVAPDILTAGKKYVDVPADFRLKDLETYYGYYGIEHTEKELNAEAVYGICELRRAEIEKARLVANPGCYATCAILAGAPLVKSGLVKDDSITIDAKSGVSGAGRSKLTVEQIFCEIDENFRAYAVASHRHTAEIEQEYEALSGVTQKVSFTPHLVPMDRGILVTLYADMKEKASRDELYRTYSEFYQGEYFIKVLFAGKQAATKAVYGNNFVHISVESDERTGRAIVTCAIDNMGKGAAGQAVQNMNIMTGLPEKTGLDFPAVYP